MDRRKILVMEPFDSSDLERMEKVAGEGYCIKQVSNISEDELKTELLDAEIVIGQPPLTLLQQPEINCPKLKLLQMTWAGTDMYTAGTLEFPKGQIMLANGSGAYGLVMSQFVVGMILSVMLNFQKYHNQQTNKVWLRQGPIRSLDHAKVLIFGAGDIGTSVAKRLSGFDCECIGVCRNMERKREYYDTLVSLEDAQMYLPEVDVVVGCIPNSAKTAGYMNSDRLKMMKKDAVIVNVGRGNFIDCMALDEVLRSGGLWGAALDVTSPEPLPADHPLWSNPRCMITPHTSGTSFGHLRETEDLITNIVCENICRYIGGEEIVNSIF